MAEPGCPLPCSVRLFVVGPSVLVFDAVVVSAQWCEVAITRFPSVDHSNRVVDVTTSCWHTAPGEYACSVPCLDPPSLLSGGSPRRGDHMCGFTGCIVTDDHAEFVVGVFGDPSSDIGYHWPETGEFSGMIGKSGEGSHGERDIYI